MLLGMSRILFWGGRVGGRGWLGGAERKKRKGRNEMKTGERWVPKVIFLPLRILDNNR